MDRRRFVLTSLAGALVAPLGVEAQQMAKVPKIGYLGVNRPEDVPHLLDALRRGLRDRGWVEGQNIDIQYRWAAGSLDRLPRLADELVRLKVDLLITPTTHAIRVAKHATRAIPIVMLAANDPVSDGFVASFARPGGNITGLTFDPGLEIHGKRVELLVQAMPQLSRVAVIGNPINSMYEAMNNSIRAAARSFNVELQFFEMRSPDEIDNRLVATTSWRPGALLIHSDGIFFGSRRRFAAFAMTNRLPTIFPWREGAEVGGFMAYGTNAVDLYVRVATFVDRILKGAKPADLPVERATKFELVINLKAAKALGLTIPPSLLARADQVIE